MISAASVALTQLRRIPRGDTIEEDHERDRQLIAALHPRPSSRLHQHIHSRRQNLRSRGQIIKKCARAWECLLAELMRIKAEGDYAAIKALVDKYAVHFDPALRDQVVERYKKLDLPAYFAGVNAHLTASFAKNGEVEKVEIHYWDNPVAQYLDYGAMYDDGLRQERKE